MGFAIPVDLVNQVVPQLIKRGTLPRPGIGIAVADEIMAQRLGIRGIAIMGVEPGSPAEKAGLQAFDLQNGVRGDVVVAVNQQPVENVQALSSTLGEAGIGETVTLLVLRGDDPREVSVKIVDLDQ